MRKRLQRWLPSRAQLEQNTLFRHLAPWLSKPQLWQLHRRNLALGLAIGLACSLIPGPLQMLGAACLALIFRANLPCAIFGTLLSNPFTIIPLYMLAYWLGGLLLGMGTQAPPMPPSLDWHAPLASLGQAWTWMLSLGQPLLLGLPLLAALLGLAGYLLVDVLWRLQVQLRYARRRKRA